MPADATTNRAALPTILERQVTQLLGARPTRARSVAGGMTMARRWIVEFENGTGAFLKAAVNSTTAAWLRTEHKIYSSACIPHLPKLIGWSDHAPAPFLLLEDLSQAHWPPPWSPQQISRALAAIKEVHASAPNITLPRLESQYPHGHNWQRIAENPGPFLALRLCSRQWLQQALPSLIAAEDRAILHGDDLVHGDFKSGNLCFAGDRIVLVDWNWAAIGNGLVDIATWLPSLAHETACDPRSILPGHASLAAWAAGNLAYWSTQPNPPHLQRLRESQSQRLRHALTWVCQELSLPKVEG